MEMGLVERAMTHIIHHVITTTDDHQSWQDLLLQINTVQEHIPLLVEQTMNHACSVLLSNTIGNEYDFETCVPRFALCYHKLKFVQELFPCCREHLVCILPACLSVSAKCLHAGWFYLFKLAKELNMPLLHVVNHKLLQHHFSTTQQQQP